MKVVTCFLADAANVREGTLSVLSGLLNQITRDSFPAPFGMSLVLVLEYPAGDLGSISIASVRARIEDGEGTRIIDGGMRGTTEIASDVVSTYSPVVVSLEDVAIPAPGQYTVVVTVESESFEETFSIPVLAIGRDVKSESTAETP